MDDKIIITCMRAEDADPRCIIEGSTKDICQTCWKEVWISPATLKFKEEKNGEVTCFVCASKMFENDDDPKFISRTPEQQAELLKSFLNDEPDR